MAEGGYKNIRVPSTDPTEVEAQVTSTLPSANKLQLNKLALVKSNYVNVLDTSFSELVIPPPPVEETVSVSQFFRLYDELFYDIPSEGDLNSHEFLIERSKEYIGFEESTPEDIQALLDEITILRQNLLDTEQEVFQLRSQLGENNIEVETELTDEFTPSATTSNVAVSTGGGGNTTGGGGGGGGY